MQTKTSLRIHYEAQAKVIRDQTGSLEDIRNQLQLSQRKMAQLLLVDPSAWNRWVKNPNSVPPSVWRSLQWYLALQGKIPGLNQNYFLGSWTQGSGAYTAGKIPPEVETKLKEQILNEVRQENREHFQQSLQQHFESQAQLNSKSLNLAQLSEKKVRFFADSFLSERFFWISLTLGSWVVFLFWALGIRIA